MKKELIYLLLCVFWSNAIFAQNDLKKNMDVFLKTAVLEGLKKDKFPLKTSEYILANKESFFVPKCPICTPITSAFREFNAQKTKTKRTKLDKNWLKQINSTQTSEQHLAFRDLIERYVSMAYTQWQFTETEKEIMEGQLRAGRKKGMAGKSDEFGKFCPSCDGACKVKKE